jgi:acetyl esterase/lipase
MTPLGWFNRLAPRPPGATLAERGAAYGPLPRQRLDVYRPRRKGGKRPVLVFFYGGGWESGVREEYAFAGRAFAGRGFVTLVPDYRTTVEAPYPAFLEDCALAVAWAQAQAERLGGDPARVMLAGHSAGAYNAAMLAMDRRWLLRAGASHPPAAWVGLSGPYDFLPLAAGPGQRTFGAVADAAATQPIQHAGPHAPATLLVHGGRDQTVLPRNTERLAARLRAAGVRAETRMFPRAGHAETVLALAWPLSLALPVLDEAAGFLHAIPAKEDAHA